MDANEPVAADAGQLSERVNDVLLAFVDFLYAVVFGLIVADTFEVVIRNPLTSAVDKTANVLLVLGVFYFLLWDWLHGRLLTLKNPYQGYRRFFLEIIVACCGYGAARAALKLEVSFVVYVILILFLGVLWAKWTLDECPTSGDARELKLIKFHQNFHAIIGSIMYLFWYAFISKAIALREALIFLVLGWLFVFQYELVIIRPPGVQSGPGVPFVSRQRIASIRTWIVRPLTRWR